MLMKIRKKKEIGYTSNLYEWYSLGNEFREFLQLEKYIQSQNK
jgi:hypothetical protein